MASVGLFLAESQTLEFARVSSSNVGAVAYARAARRLYVEFRAGANRPASLYVYHDVAAWVYEGLLGASSKGKYLDAAVKKAGYRFDQIY